MNVSTNIEHFLFETQLTNTLRRTVVRDKQPSFQARTFNSINKANCPLNNTCLSNNVLYKANKASMTEQRTMEIKFTKASVRPNSIHDMEIIENLLTTENTKQKLNFPIKSGN